MQKIISPSHSNRQEGQSLQNAQSGMDQVAIYNQGGSPLHGLNELLEQTDDEEQISEKKYSQRKLDEICEESVKMDSMDN